MFLFCNCQIRSAIDLEKFLQKFSFYADIAAYRLDIKYCFLFDDFPIFSLRWSIFLISNPIVNLLSLNLIERDSRSIFIRFNIVAVSCCIARSITIIFRRSICLNWYILLIAPIFRWFIYHVEISYLPARSISSISRWSFWKSVSAFRWFNCIIVSISCWFICFAVLALYQSARNIVSASYGSIYFLKSVSCWSASLWIFSIYNS
jgi:hypothetical protein